MTDSPSPTLAANEEADVAIIGAGAAGLAAGIFAGEAAVRRAGGDHGILTPPSIMLLDGARRIGAKILVSGGGRCNVTHTRVTPNDFQGSSPAIIRNILRAFSEQAATQWFASLGVLLKEEASGKLFPITDRAQTVLDALLDRCQALHLSVRPQHRVLSLHSIHTQESPASPRFLITHSQGQLLAKRVILATGGRSFPKTGSDGFGWTLARHLGHTVTTTAPALVPFVLEASFFHASVSGLALDVALTVRVQNQVVDRRRGSLLWTHVGVSGPVVMDASRFWTCAQAEGHSAGIECSLLPDMTPEEVDTWIQEQAAQRPKLAVSTLLAQRFPDRLATALCAYVGIESGTALSNLKRSTRHTLVSALTALRLPVTRDRGWQAAEVTAGGVPLQEIDYRTMESRPQPGLYLVGELLDCDGRIGGFNFQWAWATGFVAGRAVIASLKDTGS
jgi:predicted Rossmann fold flavoprotein